MAGLVVLMIVVFAITWFVQYRFIPLDKETHKEVYVDTTKKMFALYFSGHCLDVIGNIDKEEAELTDYLVNKINDCYEEMSKSQGD